MYKLRFYASNGNCDHEEFFPSIWELIDRYKQEVAQGRPYALRPTAWFHCNTILDEWCRLTGF